MPIEIGQRERGVDLLPATRYFHLEQQGRRRLLRLEADGKLGLIEAPARRWRCSQGSLQLGDLVLAAGHHGSWTGRNALGQPVQLPLNGSYTLSLNTPATQPLPHLR